MRRNVVGCVYSLLIFAIGCSGSATSPICTQEFRPGLTVLVKDAVTNAGIASGATLVVREGIFTDSFTMPGGRPDLNDFMLPAAGERAGTYEVSVSKPGYATWVQSNVRVTQGVCHVITVTLTALLQPAS